MAVFLLASAGRSVQSLSLSSSVRPWKSPAAGRPGGSATMVLSWMQRQPQQPKSVSSSASRFGGDAMLRMVNAPRRRSFGASSLVMMPEGPEVRTLVDQLRGGIGKRLVDIRFLSGRYLGKRPVGFAEFARTMTPLGEPAIGSNPDNGDFDNDSAAPSIDTILEWNCKGKFIYIVLDDGVHRRLEKDEDDDGANVNIDDFQRSIWITLGMTGRFVNEAKHLENPSYGRWVLELYQDTNNGDSDEVPPANRIYYHDKRNFGTVKFCLSKAELEAKLGSLGPDVLEMARRAARVEDLDDPSVTIDDDLAVRGAPQQFLDLMDKQRNPRLNVCKFLMDQKKIAGVGNYILSEALYRADIDPFCGIDELSIEQRQGLFREIQAVSFESYRSQQILSTPIPSDGYTSVRDLEAAKFELRVYGNQGMCPRGSPVIRETNGPHGRTIWYTDDQLFVPRHVRELEERQRRDERPARKSSPTKARSEGDNTRDLRWTITRRDGEEVLESSNGSANAIQGGSSTSATPAASSDWNILDGLNEPGWKEALAPYAASSPIFAGLQGFLDDEYSNFGGDQIYPPPHQIFAALNLCPLDRVKVVILGQDPYHGPNQSTGLAFSVSKTIQKIPPSLRNIFKELDDDVGSTLGRIPEIRHGDLEGWARQGVLMLNTVLTVRRGQANSHQKKGWEDVTDEIVRVLLRERNGDTAGTKGVVFLLWGGPASKKARSIVGASDEPNRHAVITTSHPSPLGATKTATPFLTSRCFSRANAALEELGETPIDWYDR